MLSISSHQMAEMSRMARARFIDELTDHAQAFQPILCSTLDRTALRNGVDDLVAEAEGFGFDRKGQLRLYVELGLLHGRWFATDPQLPWAQEILPNPSYPFPQQRAQALYARAEEYRIGVYGANNEHVVALRRRVEGLQYWPEPPERGLDEYLIAELESLFPQKAAHLGRPPVLALIGAARAMAERSEMPGPRPIALCAVLQTAFGWRCDADPFYPWIGRSLTRPPEMDGATRAERLERRAITWMRAALARSNTEATI